MRGNKKKGNAMNTQWGVEIKRRLRGLSHSTRGKFYKRIGGDMLRQAVAELSACRNARNAGGLHDNHGKARIRDACRNFDAAMRCVGATLGCSAPICG